MSGSAIPLASFFFLRIALTIRVSFVVLYKFDFFSFYFLKIVIWALAGVAQWFEYGPVNQRVAGSIPSQGTCLGCGPGPQYIGHSI